MARLISGGVALELPPGWEGHIDPGSGSWLDTAETAVAAQPTTRPDGAVRRVVAHVANFPLPPGTGDFGNGAVQGMRGGDAFVALFEYDPAATQTPLFRHVGVPVVAAADFDPAALHKPVAGGSAVQRFFQVADRAFCLYVVVGSHIDRADVIPVVRGILTGLEIT